MNGGYRMRRHARRMRRYGLQPMIMIGPNDRLPEIAAVVFARWAWHYRSELAPVWLAITVTLSAWILHATHRSWYLIIGIIAAAVAAGVGLLGRQIGLLTRIERIYAATTIAVTGEWLAAATVISPWRTPLPQILLSGGVVLSVPWWAHRRRRAKVRIERKLAAWPEIAQSVGLAGSRVMSAFVDVWGWRATFGLARGQTIQDVIAKLPAIESGLGTFRGAARVYPTLDNLAHRFELRVLSSDPHANAIMWPGPSAASIAEPIDLGPFEDATPARVLFLRRHALFGGVSGSGKSGGLNVLMASLTACSDVVIWAIDLKRGMELAPWSTCIARLATTPAEAHALLADAVAILDSRAVFLAANGKRVWTPSPAMPALVIIIDEYAELAETAPDATKYADSIARRGRAVALTLVAATQRPTQKAMGQGALRSQIDVRICFRVRERKDTDLILGQGMLAAGWHPHTLNAPGKFLVSSPEHDTPRRARAYLLTDQAVSDTASQHAGLRPALDEVSMRALDERHSRTSDPANPPSPDEVGEEPMDDGAPEALLLAALSHAPEQGISVPELMSATGMSRRWVYYRLRELAEAGHAAQTDQGNWRLASPDHDSQ